jgi:hypothetical protein
MNKTLCIMSSAFLKEGMQAEFGKIPPTFAPLCNRPFFEYQIDALDTEYNEIFISIPKGYKLELSIKLALKQKNIRTIEISQQLSVSKAIMQTLKHIITSTKKFSGAQILLGDTIIKHNSIDLLNSYSCHSPTTIQHWTYTDVHNNKVFSGFLNLSEATCRTIVHGNLGLSFINDNSLFSTLTPDTSGIWYDIGHISEYIRTRSRYDTSRDFNFIKMNDFTVTKTSSDYFKINSESFWFENLPKNLKMYTPQILGSDHSEGKYVIEKLPLITLGEIYAFGNQKQYYWKQVFSSIRNVLEDFAKYTSPELKFSYSKWVKHKTAERINNLPDFLKELCNTEFKINNKKVPNIRHLCDELDEKFYNLDLFEKSPDVITHGDLCFSNIFYDLRLGLIKLIDPRGCFIDKKYSIYGNQTYDIVKLAHSVKGYYDYVIAKQYNFDLKDGFLNYKIFPKSDHQHILNEFEKEILLPLNICEKKLNANLCHLFLSMIPLHSDQKESQIIFLGQAYHFGLKALRC